MNNRNPVSLGSDDWAMVALFGLVATAGGIWCGLQLAAIVSGAGIVSVSIGDAIAAIPALARDPAHPASAWPNAEPGQVPGPWLYWPATTLTTTMTLAGVVWVQARMFGIRVGQARRNRLGVNPNARLATTRDLAPIIVKQPSPGRFVLGTVNGRLVATESRTTQTRAITTGRHSILTRPSHTTRSGDRSAVAVIGPARSGKTVNVISSILEWDGPAILSSVRDDLLRQTIARRAALGTCYVFDPLRALGHTELPEGAVRVGWSPLQAAKTVSGAQRVASYLLEAAPLDGTTNANYFERKGEALLWPMLYAAAIGKQTMADVVQWLATQDGIGSPNGEATQDTSSGMVRSILTAAIKESGANSAAGKQAQHALSQFDGFTKLDARTRSDIYSTSQTLVQPWEDPLVSYASAVGEGPGRVGDGMDLATLLRGRNTLYVVQPIEDVHRYAVVFGGILGSMLKDQAYRISHRAGQPLPRLLVVIDEAGNTPLRWLPTVASTCAGIGVLLVTVWQSKAQIDAIYQKQADPLLTNHGSKIFFSGASDEATLRYASYLCGEEEVHVRTSNADTSHHSRRRSVGDATTTRPLIAADVLRQVAPGEGLLVHGTLPPAHLRWRRYWADPNLIRLAAGGDETELDPYENSKALRDALDRTDELEAEVFSHMPVYVTKPRDPRREAKK